MKNVLAVLVVVVSVLAGVVIGMNVSKQTSVPYTVVPFNPQPALDSGAITIQK